MHGNASTAAPSPGAAPRIARRPISRLLLSLLGVATLVALIGAYDLMNGAPSVSLGEAWDGIRAGADAGTTGGFLVHELRLPRLVLALLAGAGLGLAGVILQDSLRNPIADPSLLGVSQAASLVVALTLFFPGAVPDVLTPALSLAAGLATGTLIVLLARTLRDPVRLVLIGMIIATLLSAITWAVLLLLPIGRAQELPQFLTFSTGSAASASWERLDMVWPWLLVGIPLALACGRALNLLQLGDDVAAGLGMRVTRARLLLLFVAVLVVAPIIAITGPLTFVALLAPHIARSLLRTTNAHAVLPLSGAIGALIVLAADTAGRLLFFPTELPAGLLAIVVAGPVALVLAGNRLRGSATEATADELPRKRRLPALRAPAAVRTATLRVGTMLGAQAPARGVRAWRWRLLAPACLVAIAALVLASVLVGSGTRLSIAEAWRALIGASGVPPEAELAVAVRTPRAVMAIVAGASLGAAGALLQALTRNPLASPDLVGVTGGAVAAAVAWLAFGPALPFGLIDILLPLIATAGGLAAAAVVYALTRRGGTTESSRFLLLGILLGGVLSSATTLALLFIGPEAQGILGWVTGSLTGVEWDDVALVALYVAPGAVLLLLAIPRGNALQLGDDAARGLGQRRELDRLIVLLAAIVLTAGTVSIAGALWFVGLLAPHMVRRLIGSDLRRLVPASALAGAILVLIADFLARNLDLARALQSDSIEGHLPVGVYLAVLGVPFLISLLTHKKT